jgi:hypothetical protein
MRVQAPSHSFLRKFVSSLPCNAALSAGNWNSAPVDCQLATYQQYGSLDAAIQWLMRQTMQGVATDPLVAVAR